ncbi:MAG: hypothetical protein KJO84_01325 [Acidimicrobiia bacterium]|nr:hypothetical protein [Acidimicrobiia bacterium]
MRLLVRSPGSPFLQEVDPSTIDEARATAEWIWVDVPAVDSDTVLDLAHRFSFHELVVEDILADTEFPKIDEFVEGEPVGEIQHGVAVDSRHVHPNPHRRGSCLIDCARIDFLQEW